MQVIAPEVASKVKDILLLFQNLDTMGEVGKVLMDEAVLEQNALTVIKAFVYIVDNLAAGQSQILSGRDPGSFTKDDVYATMYAAAGNYTGENN